MILVYLLTGLFIAWIVALFITAKTENYIEKVVKTMRKDGDI